MLQYVSVAKIANLAALSLNGAVVCVITLIYKARRGSIPQNMCGENINSNC